MSSLIGTLRMKQARVVRPDPAGLFKKAGLNEEMESELAAIGIPHRGAPV
ncbi:MAG TPA: hypothetical protein VLA31_03650 [Burkholderiaceae bacterium]|nr:hypothetical protein [Burkholderiaceae bacterium]